MSSQIDANQAIETTLRQDRANQGTVVSVRGSVVDARFGGRPPLLYNVLKAGENGRTVVEVITHLDDRTVRGIA
jgi:F-type H+-transporting ATPase subunit beta